MGEGGGNVVDGRIEWCHKDVTRDGGENGEG